MGDIKAPPTLLFGNFDILVSWISVAEQTEFHVFPTLVHAVVLIKLGLDRGLPASHNETQGQQD
jgi:hypothetical protein